MTLRQRAVDAPAIDRKHISDSTVPLQPLFGERPRSLDRSFLGFVRPELLKRRFRTVADVGERHLGSELTIVSREWCAVDLIAAHREQTLHLNQPMNQTEAIVALPGFMSLTARRARASMLHRV
ncbi:hypothetical protein [Burkholderia mayonis]|uniref:hypothetical protein n=1 Tax=Burkholderia mayonis TaxID=1385591 RepID=UPI00131F267F